MTFEQLKELEFGDKVSLYGHRGLFVCSSERFVKILWEEKEEVTTHYDVDDKLALIVPVLDDLELMYAEASDIRGW